MASEVNTGYFGELVRAVRKEYMEKNDMDFITFTQKEYYEDIQYKLIFKYKKLDFDKEDSIEIQGSYLNLYMLYKMIFSDEVDYNYGITILEDYKLELSKVEIVE